MLALTFEKGIASIANTTYDIVPTWMIYVSESHTNSCC